MTDLVKRLLQIGDRISTPCPDGIKGCLVHHFRIETDPTCKEAADRIEALEAALRTLVNEHEVLGFVGGPSAEAWDAARATLGEKQ